MGCGKSAGVVLLSHTFLSTDFNQFTLYEGDRW